MKLKVADMANKHVPNLSSRSTNKLGNMLISNIRCFAKLRTTTLIQGFEQTSLIQKMTRRIKMKNDHFNSGRFYI